MDLDVSRIVNLELGPAYATELTYTEHHSA